MAEIQVSEFAQLFIGRKPELEQFDRAINPRNKFAKLIFGPRTNVPSRVFLPHGIGGIGKSFLSKKCLAKAKDAGWATIEIDWDRVDIRPSDEVELMNVVAEELKTIYGEKVIQEYLRTQRQIKQVKDRVQKLKRENQEKWQTIIESTQNIVEGMGGEKGQTIGKAISGIGSVVNLGADLFARAEDSFVDWLVSSGRLKGDESTLYKDEKRYLSRKLVTAIGSASSTQPLAILFDTCEALPLNMEEWQRDGVVCPVIQLNKPIIIIVSGRQDQYRERQADAGDNNIRYTKGYADRLTDPPPISWDISRFADPEISDYLRSHGFEPNTELIDFTQQLAKGVPYAVQLITQAFKKLGVEYVKENFPPEDISTFSAQEIVTLVTERFLRYCLQEEEDLIRIRGLAVLRNWDEGGLRSVWQLSNAENSRHVLQSLQSRYSFILPEKKLHEIIRDFIREDLRGTDEFTARDLGSRIASYYFPVWENNTKELPILAERISEPRWRNLTLSVLNALCWHSEESAIEFLAARVIESMTFDIRFAQSILDLTNEFSKPPEWYSNRSHRIVNILKQIVDGEDKEEMSGLVSLINEADNLSLTDNHQAILYLWKSRNLYRTRAYQDALRECLAAKEKIVRDNETSVANRIAGTLNSIGWKLGWEYGITKPSEDALLALTNAVEIQQNASYLYVGLGVMQYGLNQNQEALKSIETGIQMGEQEAWALNWLGNVYSGLSNWDDAIKSYKTAIENDSKYNHPWIGIANVYRYRGNKGDFQDSVSAYNKAIELNPKFAGAWTGLGLLYKEQNQKANAIDAFHKAAELDPKEPYIWNSIGNFNREIKQYQESINAYKKSIELNPKNAISWNGLGNTYNDQGEYQEAIKAYKQAIDLDSKFASPWNGIGNTYINLEQVEDAINAYKKAIEIDPENGYRWYTLGEVYRDSDLWQEAIEAYNNAVKFTDKPAYIWVRLGNVNRDHKQYDIAVSAYEIAKELDSKINEPWWEMGQLHLRLQEYKTAESHFQKAIDIEPNDPYSWNGLGYTLFKQDKYEEALSAFDKAIELDPENGEFHYSRIRALRLLNRNDEATVETELTKSLINKNNEYNRACFELICGNIDIALSLLAEAIKKKSRTRIWARHDPDLEVLFNDPRFKELVGE